MIVMINVLIAIFIVEYGFIGFIFIVPLGVLMWCVKRSQLKRLIMEQRTMANRQAIEFVRRMIDHGQLPL